MLDPLTLDQLRVFLAVADEGSFSGAARKFSRAQSAVSQAIAALEGQLRIPLFDRSAKTPKLTPAGAALAKDARRLIDGAAALKRRAACIAVQVEPELVFAVDAIFPHDPLIASLKALREEFPDLPVSIFTETLGGSEQRLRDGVAQFAIYPTPPGGPGDLIADFLAEIDVVAVVGADHPLAKEPEPIAREALEPHVQLVLTDRTPLTQNFSGGIVSHRVWRFADLSTRLEFLLAGFGWCRMPLHLVRGPIADGRLKQLKLAESNAFQFLAHVVHVRGREIGRAGRWLIEDVRARIAANSIQAGPSRPQGASGESAVEL